MESVFSGQNKKVTVIDIAYLNPFIKKITFKGDLAGTRFKTGQAVFIRVNDTSFRNYTPSRWDSDAGTFDIVFHIHGNGPGSSYSSALALNDVISIGLPRGFNFYKKEYDYHFFFGDETTIGIFESLKDVIEANGQNYIGILELNKDTLNDTIKTKCVLDIVPYAAHKAEHAIAHLHSLPNAVWELWKNGVFYLLGNARSIQNFRKALKDRGVSSRNIVTQPFWVEGKTGL